MTVSVVLKNDPDKNGLDAVMFRIHLNGKPFKISAGIKVPPKNFSKGQIFKSDEFTKGKHLNTILQLRKSIIEESQEKAQIDEIELTPSFVRDYYKKKAKIKPVKKNSSKTITENNDLTTAPGSNILSFYEMSDMYIKKIKGIKSDASITMHTFASNKLKNFDPNVKWEDFTEDYWFDFLSYMIGESPNKKGDVVKKPIQNKTIYCYLDCIKKILSLALKKKYPVPEDFFDLSYKFEEKQPFWCTWEEVMLIKDAPVFLKAEEVVRDSFYICANTGIRNSDFNKISPQSIYFNNGNPMLRLVTVKTRMDYSIPINNDVYELLKKYNLKIPRYTNVYYNRLLKRIAGRIGKIHKQEYRKVYYVGTKRFEEVVPRSDMFSTHTARRTFGRRWVDNNGSKYILQKIFGHKTEAIMMKYIGYSSFDIENEFLKVMG